MSRQEMDSLLQTKVNKELVLSKLYRKASKLSVDLIMKEMGEVSMCLE